MSQVLDDARQAPERVAQLVQSDRQVYEALGRELRERNPALVATVARGSSDHGAAYASYLFPLLTGKIVASIPPSVVSVLNSKLSLRGQFVLGISQSGVSPDILRTFECAKESGAFTAALVNDVASPLAGIADAVLPQHAGRESIAATKSVLCTFAGVARLAAEWAGDKKLQEGLARLPQDLENAFEHGMGLDDGFVKGVQNVYVLSRGLGFPAALETALKLKETCGVHAEAFSTAEVRHGPREIVKEDFLIVALALPQSGTTDVLAAAQELKTQGARVMLIGPEHFNAEMDYRLAPLVALQMLYPWLVRSSRARGFDPDHPRNLKSKVVKTV